MSVWGWVGVLIVLLVLIALVYLIYNRRPPRQ